MSDPKISIHSLLDSTARIKAEAGKNAQKIAFIDRTVAPIAPYPTPKCKVGEKAYHVNGMRPGIVEEKVNKDSDDSVIVIRGYFQRAEEWKPTPWTEDETAAYWSHRMKEAERVDRETREALAAWDEKERLRKDFLG